MTVRVVRQKHSKTEQFAEFWANRVTEKISRQPRPALCHRLIATLLPSTFYNITVNYKFTVPVYHTTNCVLCEKRKVQYVLRTQLLRPSRRARAFFVLSDLASNDGRGPPCATRDSFAPEGLPTAQCTPPYAPSIKCLWHTPRSAVALDGRGHIVTQE